MGFRGENLEKAAMIRRLVIAALLLASAPAAALAQPWSDTSRPSYGAEDGGQDRARDAVRSGRQAPLSRILATIAQRTPGRHLNTTQGDAGGRPAYFVQWQLPDGRVVIFVVDAESGAILQRQGG
jgi:uncharacterized membrane protein YkoI